MSPRYTMEGLLDYIAGFRSPKLAFIKEPLGHTEDAINAFELDVIRATGLDLPPDYREFLFLMGEQTPLNFAADADMGIVALRNFYQRLLDDIARGDEDELPPDTLVIACGGFGTGRLLMECFKDGEDATRSGRIISVGDYNPTPKADSLLGLLFLQAFSSCANRHLALTVTYTGAEPAPVLPILASRIRALGWKKHEWSDSINLCASSPQGDFSLYATQKPGQGGWLRLSGHKAGWFKAGRYLDEVVKPLCHGTDLTFERWWDT